MKYLILIVMIFSFALVAQAQQCVAPPGFVCIKQETVDKCAQIADEVIASRVAIAELKAAVKTGELSQAAADRLIAGYEKLVAVGERVQAAQNDVIQLYKEALTEFKEIVKMQVSIIADLQKSLNKPKSAFAKFLSGLEKALTIAVGIIIGRGL